MKGVLLLSDGIDSPVAGYQLGRQGVKLTVLHFVTSTDDPGSQIKRTRSIVKRLEESLGGNIHGYAVPHTEALNVLSTECKRNLTCVLCKRMMLRIAGRLADETDAAFIITGDSLGQVASQTLANLYAEEQATSLPILRPLIGMDKVEITRISKEIGTYELAASSSAHCVFAPDRPSTHSSVAEIQEEEARIDVESIANEAKNRMRRIDLGEVS